MKRTLEDNLQIACIRYTRLQYSNVLCIHVPNGGNRSWNEGKRFKQMGVVSGVPDVLIFEPQKGYNGLAIELKVGSNRSTANQIEAQLKLLLAGWKVITDVRNIEAYMVFIDNYLTDKK